MCGLCGMFESGRRWLDAAATLDPTQVRRERARRVALVRDVLKPARISVDDWEGASFVLRGPTGKTEIVDNLFDLWRKAEALGHRNLDPLANIDDLAPARVAPGPMHGLRSFAREQESRVLPPLPLGPPVRGGERGGRANESDRAAQKAPLRDTSTNRIPLYVLTGFLGSGKTTLLNHMLGDPALADSAVLINEIGAIAVDHHLVQNVDSSGALGIIVLKGGCACCVMRGDLAAALRELYARRTDGSLPPFRRIVLETTGLADPAPVLFTLAADPALRHKFEAGAVITTVDAVHGATQASHYPESRKQITVADRLVVTKSDLADTAGVTSLAAMLGRMNPAAEIIDGRTVTNMQDLLAERDSRAAPTSRSLLAYRLSNSLGNDEHAQHAEHTPGIDSVCIPVSEPIEWSAFAVWLTLLLHAHGDRILRFKALLDIEGWSSPVVLDAVHHLVHPPTHLRRWPEAERASQLIAIAQGLQVARIEPSLHNFLEGGRGRATGTATRPRRRPDAA